MADDGDNDQSNKNEEWMDANEVENPERRNFMLNSIAIGLIGASGLASYSLFQTNVYTPGGFTRTPTQFIAALGDPKSSSGTGAQEWGLWRKDPGPRGVWMRDYEKEIVAHQGVAPAGWNYDPQNWWLDEHGIIMESPTFPLQTGRYLVTGGRTTTTGLTIDGQGNWNLDDGACLYDVTHLPCRSAKYVSTDGGNGSPLTAKASDFPVIPGGTMPAVEGCTKQDYAVLFLVGKEMI